MNISQTTKNYVVFHISTETSQQVETIIKILDPEYINLVAQNSHAILGHPPVLLGFTSMTIVDQQNIATNAYYPQELVINEGSTYLTSISNQNNKT